MTALLSAVPTPQAVQSAVPDEDFTRLPLSHIRRNPNIDPRKSRNTASYAQIVSSIRDKGVIQPIIVRPISGADHAFEVVAGNTRFEASLEAGLIDIPAMIREMTDAEARNIAAIENLHRADLTPIEEAWNCVQLLADAGNDHEEVCRMLGWDRQLLDRRVLLSKCCDEVAEALVQKQIKLGHAELLAPMVEDEQRTICKAIIERGLTVQATRERLMQLTPLISTARFDTAACASCEHNSQAYADLFSNSVGDAKCQNASCWQQKTQQLIDVRVIEAKEEYGLVHTDLTLPTGGYTVIASTGSTGVGSSQMGACASCPSYGAVVSTTKGREGDVVGGHCFDLNCHKEKVAAYQSLIAATTAAPVAAPANVETAGEGSATAKRDAAPGTSVKATGAAKAKPQEIKRSIKKVAFGLYASMAKQAIQKNNKLALAISITSMYLDMRSDVPSEVFEQIEPKVNFPSSLYDAQRAAFEVELAKRSVEELGQILVQLASLTVYRRDSNDAFQKSTSGSQSLAFIKACDMNPSDHFLMNEEYLKALTKPAILLDCKASGFEQKYDEVNGAKAFSKLASGKVDDLIKTILAFDQFSWAGYLPETMKPSAHMGSGTA